MRKTFLLLGTVFVNFAIGVLAFYVVGSHMLRLLVTGGALLGFIGVLLLFSAAVCLLNLLFYKLLRFKLASYAVVALPSLLAGVALYFVLFILGL